MMTIVITSKDYSQLKFPELGLYPSTMYKTYSYSLSA